jgi:adenosylcobinamide-phosphate synthase
MVSEVELLSSTIITSHWLPEALRPDPWLLAAGVLADLAIGDPVYPAHPARLIGWTLTQFENGLRRVGLDGYGGGILLFLMLSTVWVDGISTVVALSSRPLAIALHVFFVYSLLALRDLLRHGFDVEFAAAQGDVEGARTAIARLVGRDISQMDAAVCRRAAIESLSENLADGFVSPIFWYVLLGLPGLILFKVVSTMDSMVGYKTPRYLKFGWCGARTDDLMNWIPARITYLLIACTAIFVPGCSPIKALRIGWQQHAIVPGPNSGWSEAATAGAIKRKLVGPIWANGKLVTEVWLGDPSDPPAGEDGDFPRAAYLNSAAGILASLIAIAVLLWL